jgi:hypothetical protein
MTTSTTRPKAEAPEAPELTDRDRTEVRRAYQALRSAPDRDAADEARGRIRAVLGAEAEIGDHVLTLANGERHRVEVPHGTTHNGSAVISAVFDPQ